MDDVIGHFVGDVIEHFVNDVIERLVDDVIGHLVDDVIEHFMDDAFGHIVSSIGTVSQMLLLYIPSRVSKPFTDGAIGRRGLHFDWRL